MISILLMLVLIPLSQAQSEPVPIEYGQSETFEFTGSEEDAGIFFFEATEGDEIVIEATSKDTDPYILLVNPDGEIILENDDISPSNLDARIEGVIESSGTYAFYVFAYDAGTITVSLSGTGGQAAQEASDEAVVLTIDDSNVYQEVPVTIPRKSQLAVTVTVLSGDIDTYLYLLDSEGNVVAENDDASKTTTDSYLEYVSSADGEYILGLTRYGFEKGNTSGEVQLNIVVGSAEQTLASSGNTGNLGQTLSETGGTTSTGGQADWTVLAYIAGDNDLEWPGLVDLDELEIGGGTTDKVNVIAFMDRSPEYDTSNDDWTTARIFEIGPDSGEYAEDSGEYPTPLIDTVELVDLGVVDSGTGQTLEDFLVWGVQAYPADNYAIIVNDHGGGWTGLAGDDRTGNYITMFEFAEAFKAATEAAGVERFSLLINDACLMSNVEYLHIVSPYFDYALGASEVMYGPPGYDTATLVWALNEGFSVEEVSEALVDNYINAMNDGGQLDQTPTFINLQAFYPVVEAVENFAYVYNSDPSQYSRTLGQARYNTYNYADGSHLEILIDVGDLMRQVQYLSDDATLNSAAQDVLDAIDGAMVYSQRGPNVPDTASLVNINFPITANDFISNYPENTALVEWQDLLSNYYNTFNISSRSMPARPEAAPEEPSGGTLPPAQTPAVFIPQVSITAIYPSDMPANINSQVIVSMEVVGRDIARGVFTVDQVQPDGTLRRLDTADILTYTERPDGTFDFVNLWDSGVNDFDFKWSPSLTTVTDGTSTHLELVSQRDDNVSIQGRYRANSESKWLEVTLAFNDEGVATRGFTTGADGGGLAGSLTLQAGGEFQAYNAIVTPDGAITYQPGNLYTLTQEGLSLGSENAPAGEYRLGFLMEGLGGVTGFNSAPITVDNSTADPNLQGYTTLNDGFNLIYPVTWEEMQYYVEREYYFAANPEGAEAYYIYPMLEATDVQSTLDDFITRYAARLVGDPLAVSIFGYDGLEFSYVIELDGVTYTGKAVAVYKPDAETPGLVFAVEFIDGTDPAAAFTDLIDRLTLFDVAEIRQAKLGAWDWDIYTEETYYPLPSAWMPGGEGGLSWQYDVPDIAGAFASIAVYNPSDSDARSFLTDLLADHAESQSGYVLDYQETYYGENQTWEVGFYSADGVKGRIYTTVVNGIPYAWWFEAPAEGAKEVFTNFFEPIVDGFRIDTEVVE